MIASMWPASSGPGSMTATSSIPTRYVFVPGPVNGPGFGATIRRTSGESALGTPGVMSGISRHLCAGGLRPSMSRAIGLVGALHDLVVREPHLPTVRHADRPQHIRRSLPHVVERLEQGCARREPADRLERAVRRVDEVDVTTPTSLERVIGSEPVRCDGLVVVMEVRVVRRCGRHEEPRVVPTRWTGRCDPV